MGEIAEDMLDGTMCSLCGCYFAKEKNIEGADVPTLYTHGYLVACWDCWEPGCGFEKAEVGTF